jgi:hypothetical protein
LQGRDVERNEAMSEFIFGCLAGWIACVLWNFLIVPVYRNAREAQKKGQP